MKTGKLVVAATMLPSVFRDAHFAQTSNGTAAGIVSDGPASFERITQAIGNYHVAISGCLNF